MKNIAIIGAGGLAREIKLLIDQINVVDSKYKFLGYIVSDLEKLGEYDSIEKVLGDFSVINSDIDCLVIGIGNPTHRYKIGKLLIDNYSDQVEFPHLIHPNVIYDNETCSFGKGVVVCASNVLTVNITLDDFCLVNLSCTIGHEAKIGKGAVLNPTVNISGGVTIGHGVLVGTGAQVLQYLQIGDDSVIGAGACVTKSVSPKSVAVGIPAKVVKIIDE